MDVLKEHRIREVQQGEDGIRLELPDSDDVVHVHLAAEGNETQPRDGASIVLIDAARLAGAVEDIIHKLHLSQVVLIPVAKWRKIFDVVAFSLADNEDWQAVDTAATVELNSRDPLLCGPAEFHTLRALIGALLQDAETPDQGLHLTTTAAPMMVEVVPGGAIRISVGNAALADEVVEAFAG